MESSKLLECPHCGREVHARGWINHLFFQHSVPKVEARQYLKVGRKERRKHQAQNNTISTEFQQLNTRVKTLEDQTKQFDYQLSLRSEPTEVVKQKDVVRLVSPAKPVQTQSSLIKWIIGVALVVYFTVPELRGRYDRWRESFKGV